MINEKYQILGLVILLIIMYCIIGHIEYKQIKQETAWNDSVQALELEQQKLELDIQETKDVLEKTDKKLTD